MSLQHCTLLTTPHTTDISTLVHTIYVGHGFYSIIIETVAASGRTSDQKGASAMPFKTCGTFFLDKYKCKVQLIAMNQT